jgi:hypothetical protein
MKRQHVLGVGFAVVVVAALAGLSVRAADEPIDYAGLARIRAQGLNPATSQVMDVTSWLTDVHGPRLSGSPNIQNAGEWAVAKCGSGVW